MKTFDNEILNPPFNFATKDSVSGTGGDVTVGKRFRKEALTRLTENGNIGVICLKSIIQDVVTDTNEVVKIDLMTEEKVWEYNTCWSIEIKKSRTNSNINYGDSICGKMFGINTKGRGVSQWKYKEFNRNWHDIYKPGTIKTVIELPQKANSFQIVYADVNGAWAPAPRFAFTLMESKKSYSITTDAFAARMSGSVEFKTLKEAEAYSKLITNNLAVKYFYEKMNLKGHAKDCSRFLKLIDLSQFKTGKEYAVEWNLSKDDIQLILKNQYPESIIIKHPFIDDELEKIILEESAEYTTWRTMERQKTLGEVFSPTKEVIKILKQWPLSGWEEGKTWEDPAVGNGNLLAPVALIKKHLGHKEWLSTIYACDIEENNILELRKRLLDIAGHTEENKKIVEENCVIADSLKFHHRYDGTDPYSDVHDSTLYDKPPKNNFKKEKVKKKESIPLDLDSLSQIV